jgi:hypothetical protein
MMQVVLFLSLLLFAFCGGKRPPPPKPEVYPIDSTAKSTLKIMEQFMYPDNSKWALCGNCGLGLDRSVILLSRKKSRGPKVSFRLDLSSSQWKEFFHLKNDRFHVAVTTMQHSHFKPQYIFRRPVFIVPMITFHPGHLLVDLVEGIYHGMMSRYGRVRRDSIIVLDVANPDETAILDQVIATGLYGQHDFNDVDPLSNVGQLLFSLTNAPVMSVHQFYGEFLSSLPRDVIFENVHIGLDTSKSFYYRGYRYHPHSLGSEIWRHGLNESVNLRQSKQWRRLAEPHRMFQAHIEKHVNNLLVPSPGASPMLTIKDDGDFEDNNTAAPSSSSPERLADLLLVQRNDGNRIIRNMDELTSNLTKSLKLVLAVCSLESLSLRQQIRGFRETTILMGVAGTTFHNLIFVPTAHQRQGKHGAVILMQSAEWCDFAWMFSNQAILLGSHVVVVCPSETGEAEFPEEYIDMNGQKKIRRLVVVAAARRMTKQGPRTTKFSNLTLDIAEHIVPGIQELMTHIANNATRPFHVVKATIWEESYSYAEPLESSHNVKLVGLVNPYKYKKSFATPAQRRSSSNKYMVQLSLEFLGPRPVLETLLDARYFPFLGTCFIQDEKGPTCLVLSDLGYLTTLDLTLNAAESNFGLITRLVIDNSLPLMSTLVHNSSAYLAFSSELLQRSQIVQTVSTNVTSMSYSILSYRNCAFRNNPGYTDLWLMDTNFNQIIKILKELSCSNPPTERVLQVPKGVIFWKNGQLQQNMHSRRLLQNRIGALCERESLNGQTCGQLSVMVNNDIFHQQVMIPKLGLPKRQWLPSARHPFAFFHMEKCAGTTVRAMLEVAALKHQLDHFIPCYQNLSCHVFELPEHVPNQPPVLQTLPLPAKYYLQRDLSNMSLIAGHFPWGVLESLPSCTGGGCDMTCFIMFRDPVERVISQYYERIYNEEAQQFYKTALNNLTVVELSDLMKSYRWGRWREDGSAMIVDEGMSNVYCRSLLNRKSTSGKPIYFDERDSDHEISDPIHEENDLNVVVQRMQQCVVGMQSKWEDTLRVISHWFPWIQVQPDIDLTNIRFHSTRNKNAKIVKQLRPELRKVIEDYNQCDSMVFAAAKKRFQTQMTVLNSPGYLE